jgi:hypothetical protein
LLFFYVESWLYIFFLCCVVYYKQFFDRVKINKKRLCNKVFFIHTMWAISAISDKSLFELTL